MYLRDKTKRQIEALGIMELDFLFENFRGNIEMGLFANTELSHLSSNDDFYKLSYFVNFEIGQFLSNLKGEIFDHRLMGECTIKLSPEHEKPQLKL